MTCLERWFDRLLVAYYGAVFTLMLVPVLAFMALLAVADWIDTKWERSTTSTNENN